MQNVGEAGVPGVPVELLDAAGDTIATQTTDDNGHYRFDNLVPGDYSVRFLPPAGMILSPQNVGDDAADSDADPDTGRTHTTTLAGGDYDPTLDAGLYRLGAIGDVVWRDENADGTQDGDEPGVPGVTVELLDEDGDVIATVLTGPDGDYLFDELPPATYQVRFVPPADSAFTGPDRTADDSDSDADPDTGLSHPVELDSGERDLTIDAGIVPASTLSLGDTVWLDADNNGRIDAGEPGIPGVRLELIDGAGDVIASTVTGPDGLYRFDGLAPGDYRVRVTADNFRSGGILYDAGKEHPMRSSDPTTADPNDDTDADDNGLPVPDGTVISGPVTLSHGGEPDGNHNPTLDFGFHQVLDIGGDLFEDIDHDGEKEPGDPPITGVLIELYISGMVPGVDPPIATTISGPDGEYIFENLPPNNYVVSIPVPPPDIPASSGPTDMRDNQEIGDDNGAQDESGERVTSPVIELRVGEEPMNQGSADLSVGFGFVRPVVVGDRVWEDRDGDGLQDAGEPGVPGVRVVLLDGDGDPVAEDTTDGDGHYLFDSLPPGDYQVRFDLATLPTGARVTAPGQGTDRDIDSDGDPATGLTDRTGHMASGSERLDLDLGIWFPGSLGDTVWHDVNNNGDPSDENLEWLGLEGVRVDLYRVNPDGAETFVDDRITGPEGQYLFEGLPPAIYVVRVNTGDVVNLPIETTPMEYRVTIASGQHIDHVDFGFVATPTAVSLERFEAAVVDEGVEIRWRTAYERGTLGFFVHRVAADGTRTLVSEAITLAAGSGDYAVVDLGATGGRYVLEEITTDLESEFQDGEAIATRAAPPVAGETLMVMAEEGQVVLSTDDRFANVFAGGFAAPPEVLDLTDPDRPLRLVGERIETDAGFAVYVSVPADAEIEIE